MIDLSMQSTPSLHRRTKSLFQTPHYMAPEVINGEVPTKNSDIWSIGILIHRMVFGRLPFGSEIS
jgi:serine/threonine protein kinase